MLECWNAGIERQMIGILSDLLMKCCNKKQEIFETNAEMVARHWDCPSLGINSRYMLCA